MSRGKVSHKQTSLFKFVEGEFRKKRHSLIYGNEFNSKTFGKVVIDINRVPDIFMTRDEYIDYQSHRRAQLRVVRVLVQELFTGHLRTVLNVLLTSTHPARELRRIYGWSLNAAYCKLAEAKMRLCEWLAYYRKGTYKKMREFLQAELTNADYRTMYLYIRCVSYKVVGKALGVSHTTVMRRLVAIDALLKQMLHIKFIRDFWIVWRRLVKLSKMALHLRSGKYGKNEYGQFGKKAFGKSERRGKWERSKTVVNE